MRPKWWPDWTGETVVLVAGGPSAADAPLEAVRGRTRAIVVNEGYRLAPWADALYAADWGWWHARRGLPEFAGMKMTEHKRAAEEWGLRRVEVLKQDDRISFEPGVIGSGGNSGFQALNLAVQWGARRIILVGYDATLDHGVHWHGRHGEGLRNPTVNLVRRWRRALDGAAKVLRERGIEVINASPISALENYPKMSLEAALGHRAAA